MKANQKGKSFNDFKKQMELQPRPAYNNPKELPHSYIKDLIKFKQREESKTIYGSQSKSKDDAQTKRQKKIDKLSSNPKLWKHLENKGVI